MLELSIHNWGYFLQAIFGLGIGILVYYKNPHRVANVTFFLGTIFIFIYILSHLIGVNIADPVLSKNILMFNLAVLVASPLFAHSTFAIIGQLKQQRVPLIVIYVVSWAVILFFLFNRDLFALNSVPKMYFPNYYQPGSLRWVRDLVGAVLVPAYFLYIVFKVYLKSDWFVKNRLRYLFISYFLGYGLGNFALPLVYGIHIDPIWSVPFIFFFVVPFSYAILKYELMDITIIAKNAFVYAVLVAFLGTLISLLNTLNNYFISSIPNFPSLLLPMATSIITIGLGFFVWRKIREADMLKYEFVTVMTHKFRTPLTYIKWAAEMLFEKEKDRAKQEQISKIKESTLRLEELTSALVGVSDSNKEVYRYSMERKNISDEIRKAVGSYRGKFVEKGVSLTEAIEPDLFTSIDLDRFQFALQILLDNALTYTPRGGTVSVKLSVDENRALLAVKDNGIGIPHNELPYIFSKFYRGKGAMHTDTEGMGLGLYSAKAIIERSNGRIWIQSEGENKGSTSFVSLPLE